MNDVPGEVAERLIFVFDRQHALQLLLRVNPRVEVWLESETLPLFLQSLGHYTMEQAAVFNDYSKALP